MAAEMDSPLAVTSAESAVICIGPSRDPGRTISFFHGPGESPDIMGDGRGVTSTSALSIGDDKVEFGVEDMLEVPSIAAMARLKLGVRCMGSSGDFGAVRVASLEVRSLEALLEEADVTVYPGMRSV